MHRTLILTSILISFLTLGAKAHAATNSCVMGVQQADACIVEKNIYTYGTEFGGRTTLGSDVAGTDNASAVSLPSGYYNGKTAVWSSTKLDPANIRVGVSIFGVTGIVADTVVPACGATSPTSQTCELPTGRYVYAADSGGRANNCVLSSGSPKSFTGPCWLLDPQSSTVRTSVSLNNCTDLGQMATNGKIVTGCLVDNAKYWYPATISGVSGAYGGRSLDCIDGSNSTSCWIPNGGASVSVSNLCKEDLDNAGLNPIPCKTAGTNRYVYSLPFGNRAANCIDDNGGSCFVNAANKSSISPNLLAANIRRLSDTNVQLNLFGINGTYDGAEMAWGSGAHRTKSSGAANRITYKQEATIATTTALQTAFTAYHPIPKIGSDSDAYNLTSQVTPVDRSTWSTTTCGLTDGISDRIANCVSVFGANATWDGTVKGNAGQTIWSLVTRTYVSGVAYEVWQDTLTGLLWSSLVHKRANWCRATGASNSSAVAAELRSNDLASICNNTTYQNTGSSNADSACYEGTGFNNSFSGSVVAGKGGLNSANSASQGRVKWRVPSMYDYILANHNGLRFVLPDTNIDSEEWTATISSANSSRAWTFHGSIGIRQIRPRTSSFAVRCVGR